MLAQECRVDMQLSGEAELDPKPQKMALPPSSIAVTTIPFLLERVYHIPILTILTTVGGVRTAPIVVDLGNADLGEMTFEKLAPFRGRLVIPDEERHVGHLPTEGSEKS